MIPSKIFLLKTLIGKKLGERNRCEQIIQFRQDETFYIIINDVSEEMIEFTHYRYDGSTVGTYYRTVESILVIEKI
jgi:hypothetical protein